jgi:hypothetical protein
MLKYNRLVRYDILYDKYSCLVRKTEAFMHACTFCDKLHVSRHHILFQNHPQRLELASSGTYIELSSQQGLGSESYPI